MHGAAARRAGGHDASLAPTLKRFQRSTSEALVMYCLHCMYCSYIIIYLICYVHVSAVHDRPRAVVCELQPHLI